MSTWYLLCSLPHWNKPIGLTWSAYVFVSQGLRFIGLGKKVTVTAQPFIPMIHDHESHNYVQWWGAEEKEKVINQLKEHNFSYNRERDKKTEFLFSLLTNQKLCTFI